MSKFLCPATERGCWGHGLTTVHAMREPDCPCHQVAHKSSGTTRVPQLHYTYTQKNKGQHTRVRSTAPTPSQRTRLNFAVMWATSGSKLENSSFCFQGARIKEIKPRNYTSADFGNLVTQTLSCDISVLLEIIRWGR
jgi:hypothetical protein